MTTMTYRHDRPDVIAGRYRLLRRLGEGGMGRVWAAHDELLRRDVAVKELLLQRGLPETAKQQMRMRVLREARAIARIDHPNVVRIIDVLHEAGEPFIVMELVPSMTLQQVVRAEGPIEPQRAARIGLDVLAGLDAAHQAGLLHRDIKPANILLGHDGRVVLTDFGLATATGDSSITATGVVVGSPDYVAPERVLDNPAGPAADLWSLGATLYTAVEGRPPYAKSTPALTLAAVATDPPRQPTRAGALGPALQALLQRDPAKRPDIARAEGLLRAATGPAPASTSRVTASTADGPDCPRRDAIIVAIAAILLILGLGLLAGAGNEAGSRPGPLPTSAGTDHR